MKKRNLIVILAIVALVASSFSLGAFLSLQKNDGLGGGAEIPRDQIIATSGTMYIGSSASIQILATSGKRAFVLIGNNATSAVYIRMANDAAAAVPEGGRNGGFIVGASSTELIVSQDRLYTGAIQAIYTQATPTTPLIVIEGTYR